MTITVSLCILVDELQTLPNEGATYLHKVSGRIITVTDADVVMAEMDKFDEEFEDELKEIVDEVDGEDFSWEIEYFQDVKRILADDADYLELPTRFEIHEYEIMESFCLSVSDGKVRDVLLQKIRGSGAFRRYKDAIYQYGIESDWLKYRDDAYKEFAVEWLKSKGIAYSDDMNHRGKVNEKSLPFRFFPFYSQISVLGYGY